MMNKEILKLNWLFSLLVIFSLSLTPGLVWADDYSDDEDEDDGEEVSKGIEVEGKGSDQSAAVMKAWKAAMMRFAKKNVTEEIWERNGEGNEDGAIYQLISKNWRSFCKDEDPDKYVVVKKFRNNKIKIRVQLEEEALLKEIHLKFQKSEDLLKGLQCVIVSEKEPDIAAKDECLDRDEAFAAFQDVLGKSFTVRSAKAMKDLITADMARDGVSALEDPEAYAQVVFAAFKIVFYLAISTELADDPVGKVWVATISVRAVQRETANEIFRFDLKSGESYDGQKAKVGIVMAGLDNRMARKNAIRSVAAIAAEKAIKQTRTRTTAILRESEYLVKFRGFSPAQKDKIDQAIAELSGPKGPFESLKGREVQGSNISYTMKWNKTKHSQDKVIRMIREKCEENELKIDEAYSSQGVFALKPRGSSSGD